MDIQGASFYTFTNQILNWEFDPNEVQSKKATKAVQPSPICGGKWLYLTSVEEMHCGSFNYDLARKLIRIQFSSYVINLHISYIILQISSQ